jgi:PiT family inorganic phosphate transporter
LPEALGEAVNWDKATDIGLSLLISPLFGFSMTIILMYIIRSLTKKTSYGESLFKEPKKNSPPPAWIRGILILTCTLVSFFHGSNDGQKGVGLVMLILIGIVPAFFALDQSFSPSRLPESLVRIEQIIGSIDSGPLSASDKAHLAEATLMNERLQTRFAKLRDILTIPKGERFLVRKDIMIMDRSLTEIAKRTDVKLSESEKITLKAELKKVRKVTDYSPKWVLIMISVSLGLGTMIGWKRIVKTVGEKIGKEHLTYAQGASAEMVAASTIGLSSYFGLPVSTTHVLSSGIAGSMVANKGVKNLQPDTVRNILIAWFLTLPVVMLMAGTLFLVFRAVF